MTTVGTRIDEEVSATGGSARSQLYDLGERSWKPRPVVSGAIVAFAFVIPVLASVAAVQIAARAVRRPTDVVAAIAWVVALVALASITMWTIDRISRKLLPLAAMLRLSLVFPDSAPSRFAVALKTGSGKALERSLQRASTAVEFSTNDQAAALVVGLISAVSTHDRLTRGHSERVRAYADLIGEELGLDQDSKNKLHWAALLHDVGKLDVPAEILNKTEKLTATEWEIIRGHPGASAKWLVRVQPWLGEWARAASEHHERYDGDGYPNGLSGDDISLAGRIVAVADAFDVMTAARSYKKPYPAAQARVELANNAGTQFDPKVVRAFLAISLSRLRLVMGPLAWLSGLSGLVSVGSVASSAATAVTATAVAASALAAPAAASATHKPRHAVVATVSSSQSGSGSGSDGANGWSGDAGNSDGGSSGPGPATALPGGLPTVKRGAGKSTDTVPVTPITSPSTGKTRRSPDGSTITPTPTPSRGDDTNSTPGGTTPVTAPGDTTPVTTPGDTTPVTTPATTPVTVGPTPVATTPVTAPHAPVATADTTGTLLNSNVLIDVLANDSDIDGNLDPSTLKIITLPAAGATQIQVVGGEIRVQVATLYSGKFAFRYQVCDTTGLCATAAVTVTFLAAL